ncbi:MAG: ABC transporter permease [Verrucomicrobia bacterium]|nr:ABC transporter permease [Verrucomicrobiota bacterium]MBV9272324.1 ABC transporter permease [Verrucomicrobiota bacterium]
MSSPLKLNFSKFPEAGLIIVIVVLGILLSIFGGEVQRPKMVMGSDGQWTRAMEKDASGQEIPAFVKVNNFFNAETLTQIAKDTSFFAIMAVGVTCVIITAGIDLSVGSVYALAAVAGAMYMNQFGSDGSPGAAVGGVIVTLVVALICGALNGVMIVAFNLHPFIITLGTMAIYRGIAFVLTNGQSIGGFPEGFRDFVRQGVIGDLSLVPLIVMVLVCILGTIFLSRMAVGRKVYAIGGNEVASRYSGIRVGMVKLLVYIIGGATAGIAAVLALGYYGAASSGDGQGYELTVIAGAVVGGASLFGGKGSALGAVLGAIILQMIATGIVIIGIPQSYSQIVTGVVVITAVLLDQFNRWVSDRRLLAETAHIKKEVVQASDAAAPVK